MYRPSTRNWNKQICLREVENIYLFRAADSLVLSGGPLGVCRSSVRTSAIKHLHICKNKGVSHTDTIKDSTSCNFSCSFPRHPYLDVRRSTDAVDVVGTVGGMWVDGIWGPACQAVADATGQVLQWRPWRGQSESFCYSCAIWLMAKVCKEVKRMLLFKAFIRFIQKCTRIEDH